MKQQNIHFWIAVIININIIVGAGFFLEAQNIAQKGGLIAPLAWVICGLMLAPLIMVFARLAKMYPMAGGLYVYSQKTLGSFWGFVSGWGYFIGTIAGNAAIIHAFSRYIQNITYLQPILTRYKLLGLNLDILLIVIFMLTTLLDIQFLEKAQITFALFKAIPILALCIAGIALFDIQNITTAPVNFSSFFDTIPMAFFAYIGIEACCAIIDKIKDSAKKASLLLWLSFILIMIIYIILQTAILFAFGQTQTNPFLSILPRLTNNLSFITWGNNFIYLSIAMSYLGGYYAAFYYNNWNLYAIAKDNSIVGSKYLTPLNKNQIPKFCVLIQAVFTILFLLITQANNHSLITMCDFGIAITYFLSALSFVIIVKNISGIISLLSCAIFLYMYFTTLVHAGLNSIIPFLLILGIGLVLYRKNNKGVAHEFSRN